MRTHIASLDQELNYDVALFQVCTLLTLNDLAKKVFELMISLFITYHIVFLLV